MVRLGAFPGRRGRGGPAPLADGVDGFGGRRVARSHDSGCGADRNLRVLGVAVVAILLAVSCMRAPAAAAEPGLLVAVTDDAFLWRPDAGAAVGRELGLSGFRVALGWVPGQTELDPADLERFDRMLAAADGLRVVVTVFGDAGAVPVDAAGRDAYCAYVRDLLTHYPSINDIVIWNEPNLGFFWRPQFTPGGASAAPAAYQALLARCWDVLHDHRPGVNVITTTSPSGNDNPFAVSNVSHSPGAFVRKMGAAYRASGRQRRIFDTVGHNPYGMSSAESPARRHLMPSHVAQGDADRLVQALVDGFGGTGQPVPGTCPGVIRSCVSIWYLEAGYQTVPDAEHRSHYMGRENDARPIPVASPAGAGPVTTQITQLELGIRLAYCQPYVGAFFNFLLWDEADLARWQSGVLWADGTPKASFAALRAIVDEVKDGRVDCAGVGSAQTVPDERTAAGLVERIEWPSISVFSTFNEIWRFAISVRADARYRATILRVGRGAASTATEQLPSRAGKLRRGRPRVLQFPQRRLQPGVYRIEVTVTRTRKPPLVVTRRSAAFTVR